MKNKGKLFVVTIKNGDVAVKWLEEKEATEKIREIAKETDFYFAARTDSEEKRNRIYEQIKEQYEAGIIKTHEPLEAKTFPQKRIFAEVKSVA